MKPNAWSYIILAAVVLYVTVILVAAARWFE